jgi:hypothetical protein
MKIPHNKKPEDIGYRKTKGGLYRNIKSGLYYYYKDSCIGCGEPFLSLNKNGKFCSHECQLNGENNPFYGKHHTEETKKILRKIDHNGKNNGMYGRHHTEEAKKKIGEPKKGKHPTEETRKKLSRSHKGLFVGEKNPMWKGGVKKRNVPLYDTNFFKIEWCEEVRRSPCDKDIMEVRCTYCGRWFVPSRWSVRNRIHAINGGYKGEHRFYCSKGCKKACPLYGKTPEQLMKEDAVRAGRLNWLEMNREVQPELRQMVLERDNYTCRKCGATDKPLHCHHIYPVAINPIESADIDNCMTLCYTCHKEVHQKDGCRYGQIEIEVC